VSKLCRPYRAGTGSGGSGTWPVPDFILRFLEWGLFAVLWGLLLFGVAAVYEIWLAARQRLRPILCSKSSNVKGTAAAVTRPRCFTLPQVNLLAARRKAFQTKQSADEHDQLLALVGLFLLPLPTQTFIAGRPRCSGAPNRTAGSQQLTGKILIRGEATKLDRTVCLRKRSCPAC
jgi:hypothetical protein